METTVYIVQALYYDEEEFVIDSVYSSREEAEKARAHLMSLTDEHGGSVFARIDKRDLLSSF